MKVWFVFTGGLGRAQRRPFQPAFRYHGAIVHGTFDRAAAVQLARELRASGRTARVGWERNEGWSWQPSATVRR